MSAIGTPAFSDAPREHPPRFTGIYGTGPGNDRIATISGSATKLVSSFYLFQRYEHKGSHMQIFRRCDEALPREGRGGRLPE